MLHLSLPEQILLAVSIVISILLFWRRFSGILERIRLARPEPGYQTTRWDLRIRDFIWEVALQGKVIRERPLPGLAHALVFWGFCAFALVTADHFASGFGWDMIPRETGFGQLYFGAVAVFAAAVAIGITALAIRRYLARPRWLEPITAESGIIAALILLLMLTYLATYLWPEDTLAGRLNWWTHTFTILVFLPLVPHTKHLHLILSPFTILLRRTGFSAIPPLEGDEDFGLITGQDVTNIVTLQAYSCVECGRCTEHCPAYNTGKILNPKAIALGFRDYLNEHGPASEEPLLAKHLSMEAAFQCTTCGACEYQCPVGIEHLPMIVGLRRGAVNTGAWDDSYGTKLFLNLESYGNPLGIAHSERQKFIEKAELPWFDGTQEYCLWMGCMGSYDPQGRDTVLALAKILKSLDISFGVLRKESCTGDSARRLGNDLLFETLVETNSTAMEEAGVKKLLSICPHCVRTVGNDWKQHGAARTIEHHSELLARVQDRLPKKDGGQGKVVFHDPCYLGRYRGIYDEPRDVIRTVAEPIDPPRTRERAFCCGAGGGLAFLGEEKGERVSENRARELVETGADRIAAACPFCHTMFRDALKTVSSQPPPLVDIAQLVAERLPS